MLDFCRRPVAVDLFAGAGGFSLGIEQAGFDVAVAVEVDPIHAATHAYNFPHTKVLCADARKLSGKAIKEAAIQASGEIDLVIGGPPCQGFSLMGKRCLEDERNDLVFEFCRLVVELQPRYFVMENVPGIAQKEHAIYLDLINSELEAAGYYITQPVKVLKTAEFGVPQNRKRLILLGSRAGERQLEYPKPPIPNPQSLFTTVRDAIADLPNLDDFPELLTSDEVLLERRQLKKMRSLASLYALQLMEASPDVNNFAYRRLSCGNLLTGSLRTQHSTTSIERFQKTLPGELESVSRFRRLHWDKLSHTLRAGTGSGGGRYTSPRPIHPDYHRVISVREAARLHSFPDWFRFHTTKWHGFRQIGNSVPPLLARAVGRQVIASLGIIPPKPKEPIELGNTQLLRFNPWEAARYWSVSSQGIVKLES
jgi:DNA (cytosine-5)-methyltransferase 1